MLLSPGESAAPATKAAPAPLQVLRLLRNLYLRLPRNLHPCESAAPATYERTAPAHNIKKTISILLIVERCSVESSFDCFKNAMALRAQIVHPKQLCKGARCCS